MAVKSKAKTIALTEGTRNKIMLENNALKLESSASIEQDAVGALSSANYNGYSFSASYSTAISGLWRLFDQNIGTITTGNSLSTTVTTYPATLTIVPPNAKIMTKMDIYNGASTGLLGISRFSIYGNRADNGEKIKLVGPFIAGWTSSSASEKRTVEIPPENHIACTRWDIEEIQNEHDTSYTSRAAELKIWEKIATVSPSGDYTSIPLDLGEQMKQVSSVAVAGTYTSNIVTTVAYSNDGLTFGSFVTPTTGKGRYAKVKASLTKYGEALSPTITSLSLNYEVEDKYLIKEGTDFKTYIGGIWNSVGQTLDRALLIGQGMSDISTIPRAAWQSLNNPEIICLSEEANATRTARVTGVKKPYTVLALSDLDVKVLKRLSVLFQQTNSGIIRIFVSSDSGNSWKAKKQLDLQNNVDIETNGYSPDEFNALTDTEWKTLSSSGKLRLGFYLNRMASADIAAIDSISREDYSYESAPTASALKVDHSVKISTPLFYVSRDDGQTWMNMPLDEMVSLKDLPSGKNLRVKIELKNGQVLQGLAYSWT